DSTTVKGNSGGILVKSGATNTRIGTDGDGVGDFGERNVLAGASFFSYEVEITGAGSNANVVAGNYIGTDATGATGVDIFTTGVVITNGAKNNIIGTNSSNDANNANERNVISGTFVGVQIAVVGTTGNVVAGNYLGVTAAGSVALANGEGVV